MPPSPTADATTVAFFFDPACPWTWLTSRWLVDVAERNDLDVTWRAFSLALANEGNEIPEQFRALQVASQAALRIVEHLQAEGRNDEIGAFYTELGRRWFHDDEPRSVEVVRAAAEAAGVGDVADRAEVEALDLRLAESLAEARSMVGDDVGSPVLAVDGSGLFGPIISSTLDAEDADRLWQVVTGSLQLGAFHELKRSRTGGPSFGPRP